MAEAIVDGTSSISRFFCHRCNTEIEHLLPDYTCPRCSTGFIEELERGGPGGGAPMDVDGQDISDIEFDIQDGLESFLLRAASQATRNQGGRNNGFRRRSHPQSESSDPSNTSSSRNSQNQGLPPQIDSLIQDIFFNLSGIGFGLGGQGQAPVFDVRLFLGNPGDYVWGQSGLDSIVTQLLNQMDGSGPPPLAKQKIDEIPTTKVTQLQVDSKLQCSVCWEDFVFQESVRQLPCQHCYHAPCIVPWLELHGTCPICRQSLGEQSTADANQDTVGPTLTAIFRAANETNSRSSSRNDAPNDI